MLSQVVIGLQWAVLANRIDTDVGKDREYVEIDYKNWFTYGGWEFPRAAIWKLDIWEGQWCNSAWAWRPEDQRADDISPGLSLSAKNQEHPAKGRRRWMTQLRQRANSPFLCLLLCSDSQRWVMPARTGEGISCTWSSGSDANLSSRHPHRHTQRQVTSYVGISAQSGWHIQLTITFVIWQDYDMFALRTG